MFVIVEPHTRYCLCEDDNLQVLKLILRDKSKLYAGGKIYTTNGYIFELVDYASNKILETGDYETLWKNSENYAEITNLRIIL